MKNDTEFQSVEITIHRYPDGSERRVRTEPGGFAGTKWGVPYTVPASEKEAPK